MEPHSVNEQSGAGRKRVPGLNLLALGLFAGLLIWAKLRLVTDFPRVVQAEPERPSVEPEPAAAPAAELTPTKSGREPEEVGPGD
jgi:hypothetical protein